MCLAQECNLVLIILVGLGDAKNCFLFHSVSQRHFNVVRKFVFVLTVWLTLQLQFQLPYMAKLSRGTFVVREENGYSWKKFCGSMLM